MGVHSKVRFPAPWFSWAGGGRVGASQAGQGGGRRSFNGDSQNIQEPSHSRHRCKRCQSGRGGKNKRKKKNLDSHKRVPPSLRVLGIEGEYAGTKRAVIFCNSD